MTLTESQRSALLGLLGQYVIAAAQPGSELPVEFFDARDGSTHTVNDLLMLLMDGDDRGQRERLAREAQK